MKPLLDSQFQGALWGAVVGLAWARYPQASSRQQPLQLWHNLAWRQQLETAQLPLLQSLPLLPANFNARQLHLTPLPNPTSLTTATLVATTLPLGVYYHAQPTVPAQELQDYLQSAQASALLPLVETIHQLLGCLLRGDDLTMLPSIPIDHSKHPTLAQGIHNAITCVQTTPDQFWLSLKRARHLPEARELATMIVGALAGAYNGYPQMPLLAPATVADPIRQRANILYAHWCGMDTPQLLTPGVAAIANPGIRF
jgi:hypothetical protein